jgi:phosphohistidine phosphatase
MLTLSLLRHAKSSWADPAQDDFDRPLNERGREAAPRVGAYMAEQKLAPTLILCSPAVRTRQTLALVLPHLQRTAEVAYEDDLYLASTGQLLKRIRKTAAAVSHLMIVGHDPGMHAIATKLASSGDPATLDLLAAKFPTAGLAVILFDTKSWADVGHGDGRLRLFMTPKRLP